MAGLIPAISYHGSSINIREKSRFVPALNAQCRVGRMKRIHAANRHKQAEADLEMEKRIGCSWPLETAGSPTAEFTSP
jgi:hypothetical protein